MVAAAAASDVTVEVINNGVDSAVAIFVTVGSLKRNVPDAEPCPADEVINGVDNAVAIFVTVGSLKRNVPDAVPCPADEAVNGSDNVDSI